MPLPFKLLSDMRLGTRNQGLEMNSIFLPCCPSIQGGCYHHFCEIARGRLNPNSMPNASRMEPWEVQEASIAEYDGRDCKS